MAGASGGCAARSRPLRRFRAPGGVALRGGSSRRYARPRPQFMPETALFLPFVRAGPLRCEPACLEDSVPIATCSTRHCADSVLCMAGASGGCAARSRRFGASERLEESRCAAGARGGTPGRGRSSCLKPLCFCPLSVQALCAVSRLVWRIPYQLQLAAQDTALIPYSAWQARVEGARREAAASALQSAWRSRVARRELAAVRPAKAAVDMPETALIPPSVRAGPLRCEPACLEDFRTNCNLQHKTLR